MKIGLTDMNLAQPAAHSRRMFLARAGGVAAVAGLIKPLPAAYRGLDKIKFGYAAMTWAKEERQAVDDISSAGFQGVQFRIDATTEFQPAELRRACCNRKNLRSSLFPAAKC